MSFELSYLIPPVLGGIIGYITNDIAIRMLFRPHKPKYIFGCRIPFTPGIIPKEKGRIATAIGGAISENLMSKEVLEKNLLSDEMIGKIKSSIDSFFAEQKVNEETVREFMLHFLTPEEVEKLIFNVRQNLKDQVSNKISDPSIGEQISEVVVEHVSKKIRLEGLPIDIPGMIRNMIGNSIWGQIANLIEVPAKHFLAKNINQILTNNGPEIADSMINKSLNDFADMKIRDLLNGKDEQIKDFSNSLIGIYRTIITDHLPKILGAIDIPHIIESRINEMDMDETEKLIFQVMDKELKAVIWLGALLGLLMGCINLLV